MIEWLKVQGFHWFDLSRINERTHPGTTQLKLGLAGKLGRTVDYLGEFQSSESRKGLRTKTVSWQRPSLSQS